MIAKLTGRVDTLGTDWAVIDVNGVGYLVFCSSRTLGGLAMETGTVSLVIETHVREDHIHLYGFVDAAEREWFRLLTTVQGVGAKVGLAILSVIPVETMGQAIAAQDAAALTQAPGVGKKLATRITSELKDKVGDLVLGAAATAATTGLTAISGDGEGVDAATADAVSALVNLGYGRTEAFGAVAQAAQRLGDGAGVEALIRDGLAELGTLEARGETRG